MSNIEGAPKHLSKEEQEKLASELLKQIRKGNLRYAEVAVMIGVSEACVRNWCGGNKPISYPYQDRVMKVLSEHSGKK